MLRCVTLSPNERFILRAQRFLAESLSRCASPAMIQEEEHALWAMIEALLKEVIELKAQMNEILAMVSRGNRLGR